MTDDGSRDLAQIFGRLQSVVMSATALESFLQTLTELATDTARSMSCGITSSRDGQPLTVASSDDRASALDESQYRTDQGPCLQTLYSGEVVIIDDVDLDTRWPAYLTRARTIGLRCSLSLPLTVDGATVGAMNLYGFDDREMFTGELRRRCELFAAQASGALQLTLGRLADQELLDQLESALTSRTIIDQAIGILMGQQRCGVDAAFALLRTRSQSSQQKLREVAAELITRVSGEEPQSGRLFDRR